MVKLLRSVILAILVFFTIAAEAQDPHFSQFYANPLYLNPAFAGSKVCPRLILNYRNQWPAIPGSYVTYNASFDMHFKTLGGGLGVIIVSDRAGEGVLTTNSASLIYSARIKVTRDFYIKAGLQAGYFQKTLDWNKLTFGDQIDSRWGFSKETNEPRPNVEGQYSTADVDFAAGILGYSRNLFIGFSASHLVPVDESFLPNYSSFLKTKFTFHAGGNIPLTERGRRRLHADDPILSPNFVYMQQGPYSQFNYGMYFKKQPMIFGLWYRHYLQGSDAIIALVGFEYEKFKFGYSYDITISELANASGGAHEFSIAMDFNCPYKKVKMHEINCPSF